MQLEQSLLIPLYQTHGILDKYKLFSVGKIKHLPNFLRLFLFGQLSGLKHLGAEAKVGSLILHCTSQEKSQLVSFWASYTVPR